MTITLSPLGYKTVDIMIDHDDVVQPWFEPVDERCREAWDPEAKRGPCKQWSMWEHYERSQDEWGDVVGSAIEHGLYTSVDPFPGAVEALNRLRWFGHRVHIVTARGFMQNSEKIRAWTPAYYQTYGIGYDTLTFAKDKVAAQDLLRPRYSIADLDKPFFDYAIDDGGHNYDTLADAGVNVWLNKAPHNEEHRASQRVDSLWDFANMILEETVPAHILEHIEATG